MEEVISWFGSLPVRSNNNKVVQHLVYLSKNGNNPVRTWTKLFAECMIDINDKINNYDNDKNVFLQRSGKTENDLNTMTKKEFVLLFSKTMNEIKKEEAEKRKEEAEKRKEEAEKIKEEAEKSKEEAEKSKELKELQQIHDREEMEGYGQGNGFGHRVGGSKKTKRKTKTSQKRRRNYRRRRTYKK